MNVAMRFHGHCITSCLLPWEHLPSAAAELFVQKAKLEPTFSRSAERGTPVDDPDEVIRANKDGRLIRSTWFELGAGQLATAFCSVFHSVVRGEEEEGYKRNIHSFHFSLHLPTSLHLIFNSQFHSLFAQAVPHQLLHLLSLSSLHFTHPPTSRILANQI